MVLMGGHFAGRGGAGVPALSRVTGRDVYKGAAAALGGANAEVREASLDLLLAACTYYRDTTPGLDDAGALDKVLRLVGGGLSAKAKDMLTQRHARAIAERDSGSGAPGPSASDAPRSPPQGGGRSSAGDLPADTIEAGDPELAALAKSLQAALSPTGGHMTRAEIAAEEADEVPLALTTEGGVSEEGGAPRTPAARRRAKRRETGLISSNEIQKHVSAAAAGAEAPPVGASPLRTPSHERGDSPGTFDTPDGANDSTVVESMPHAAPRSRLSTGAPALRLVMDAPGAVAGQGGGAHQPPRDDDDGASVASGASQEGDWNLLEATRLEASAVGGAGGLEGELAALRSIVASGTPSWMLEALRDLFAAQRMFTEAVAAARQERRGSSSSAGTGGADMTVVAQELHPSVGTVDASSAPYVKGLAAVHTMRSRLAEASSSAEPAVELAAWVSNAHLLLKTLTTLTAAAFGGSVRPMAGPLAPSGKTGDDVWCSVGHAEVPFALPCVTLLADWFGVPPLAEATDSACMNSLLLETTQRICDDALSKGTRSAVSKLLMRMTFRARQDVVLLALVNALARASTHQSSKAETAGAHTGQTRLPTWAIKNLCSLLNRATTHITGSGKGTPYAGLAVRNIVQSVHEYLLSHRTSLADTPQTNSPLYAVLVLLRQLVHYRVNDTLGALRSPDAAGETVPPSAVVWVYTKQFVKQLHPSVASAEGFTGAAGAVPDAPQVAATMTNLSGGKSRTGGAQDEVGGVLVLNAVVGCYIRALQVAITSGSAKSDEARAMGVLAACEQHYPELGITLGAVEERVVSTPAKRQILKAKRMVYRTRTGGAVEQHGGGVSSAAGDTLDGNATYSATYERLAARLGDAGDTAVAPPAAPSDTVTPPSPPIAGKASVPNTPPRQEGQTAHQVGVSPQSVPAGATGIPRSSATAASVLGLPSSAQDSIARTAMLRERMKSIKQRMGASKATGGARVHGDAASGKENSS